MSSSGREFERRPDDLPRYRFLTGNDDRAFCERVSEALDLGWELYGSPALTMSSDGTARAGQALLWPQSLRAS
jgi:hypothetical protein